MRLTVGGFLIILGIGATVGYFIADHQHSGLVLDKIKGFTKDAGSLVGLFKTGEEKKEVYAPPPPFPNGVAESVPANGSVSTTSAPALGAAVQEVAAATPEPTPEPTPKVAQATPIKKVKSRRKKGATKKPVAVTAKAPVKTKKAVVKPTPKTVDSSGEYGKSMFGTYVSMDLVTGRAVQGILESKSATHYTLNVPGMGPMEYPIENVKSIVPAK